MKIVGIVDSESLQIPVDGARPIVLGDDGELKLGRECGEGYPIEDLVISFYYEFESEETQKLSKEAIKIRSLVEVISKVESLIGDGILAIKRLPTDTRFITGISLSDCKRNKSFITCVDLVISACTSGTKMH